MPLSIGTCLTSRSSLRKPQATPLRTSKPKCECPLLLSGHTFLVVVSLFCFYCVLFIYLFIFRGRCLKILHSGQQKTRTVFTKWKRIFIYLHIAFFLVHEQFASSHHSHTNTHKQQSRCAHWNTRDLLCVWLFWISIFCLYAQLILNRWIKVLFLIRQFTM